MSIMKPVHQVTRRGPNRGGAESAAESLERRFWAKVDKNGPGGCWIWTGAKSAGGHGVIWTGGQPYQKPAHHVSLMFVGVTVPEGMYADHICRVRACVNPDHLRVVTAKVNALENNDSPMATNARKTHCIRGHPLSGDNIRWKPCIGPKGTPMATRWCIACYGSDKPRKPVPPPNTREDALAQARAMKRTPSSFPHKETP